MDHFARRRERRGYRVSLDPGTFRIETDPGVFAEALRATVVSAAIGGAAGSLPGARPAAPPMEAPAPAARLEASQDNMKQLIDRYRNEGGGRTVRGALPVDVTFPSMGPSLFMAAELTAEAQSPSIDLAIRRINK